MRTRRCSVLLKHIYMMRFMKWIFMQRVKCWMATFLKKFVCYTLRCNSFLYRTSTTPFLVSPFLTWPHNLELSNWHFDNQEHSLFLLCSSSSRKWDFCFVMREPGGLLFSCISEDSKKWNAGIHGPWSHLWDCGPLCFVTFCHEDRLSLLVQMLDVQL